MSGGLVTRAFACVLLLLVPALAPAAESPARAAVIVVGPDGVATGALQSSLEAALAPAASSAFVVVPSFELAPRIGTRAGTPESPKAAQMIEEGRKLFYDGQNEEALDRLSKAAALPDAPPRERIRASLHRAVVLQTMNDERRLNEALTEVLRLDPHHAVSVDEFPPGLRDLVEALKRVTRTVTVKVSAVAPGAEATLDGRPFAADRTIEATPGKHELAVRAPGFRRLATDVTVPPGATTLDVVAPALPIAFVTAQESTLSALAARKPVSDPAFTAKLAAAAKVDALVIVSLFGAVPEALVVRGDRREGKTFADAEARAIADWAAGAVRRLKPVPGGPFAGPQRTLSAGSTVLAWDRTVSGGGADDVTLSMGGAGATVSGLISGERLAGQFDVAAVTFAMSSMEATLPGDGRATGTGGGYLHASARGGYGVLRLAPADVWVWAGLDAERYGSPQTLAALRLPLFVSWAAVSPAAGVEAQWRPVPSISAVTAVSVLGGGAYVEGPADTTGSRPEIGVSPGARIAVRWAASSRWRVDAGWSVESRVVRFHGRTSTAFEEPIRDATLVETRQAFTIGAGRQF